MRGFGKRRCTKNVVINMTNFDTPTIDTMLSRFPAVAEDIFKELNNKSLTKCRKVSVQWQNFIDNQKFIWLRKILKYNGSMTEFSDHWKRMITSTSTDHVKELSTVMETFFEVQDSKCKSQWAPLHIAAIQGQLEMSKFIMQRTKDNNPTRIEDQTTALHMAAFSGHTEICRCIVDMLDDKNPADKDGETPLSRAVLNGHLETYQLIAESLGDKNPPVKYGLSSLHLASEIGQLEVCKYIMDNILDKNPPGVQGSYWDGLTPYDLAAGNGQLEICKLFLETLANKNPVTFLGRTPLHYAAYAANAAIYANAANTDHLGVCKVILQSIEDKNPVSHTGCAPIHCAADTGHLEILRLFLDNGADRRSTYFGRTPIEIAALNGHFRACLLLMSNLQDFVSFPKIIWNNLTYSTAKVIILVELLVLGVLVLAVFLSDYLINCFKEGSCQ